MVADEGYLEPAHDTLVLAWQELLEWLDRYGPQELQRQLWRAAEAWDETRRGASPEKARGLLWADDPRLPTVRAIRGGLNRLEGEFVDASARRKRARRTGAAALTATTVVNVVALAAFLTSGFPAPQHPDPSRPQRYAVVATPPPPPPPGDKAETPSVMSAVQSLGVTLYEHADFRGRLARRTSSAPGSWRA